MDFLLVQACNRHFDLQWVDLVQMHNNTDRDLLWMIQANTDSSRQSRAESCTKKEPAESCLYKRLPDKNVRHALLVAATVPLECRGRDGWWIIRGC